MIATFPACPVCGAGRWMRLPDPGSRSMASDWRVLPQPLAKHACEACGVGMRPPSPETDTLYSAGYELYARAPGESFERVRQAAYASWIAAHAGTAARILDIGCGNGSLLLALREHWPAAELFGCDPSSESVRHGAGRGMRLWQGSAADLPGDVAADLVITVNVIEHTADPVSFLSQVRAAVRDDGRAVVVCPDGGRPGVELLFADHLWSFTPEHLSAMFARAGLVATMRTSAPLELGAFQMIVGRAGAGAGDEVPDLGARTLNTRRRAYLAHWRDLDDHLVNRLPPATTCFGVGEAAGLLRAYAPRTWDRVRACTSDAPGGGRFGDRPVVPLPDVADDTVLVAVRPADQERVATRLRERFPHVVTWYDLVPEPQA